jgi:hypothetical protein
VNDQHGRFVRLRYTAAGALAALAAVGAIAGTVALAASPRAKAPSHAAEANCAAIKAPASSGPSSGKGQSSQTASAQPFLTDVQRLVDNGTISATEGQVLDREVRAGRIDTQTLTSSGFTQAQLQAVQQTLGNTKRAMAQNAR